VLFDLQSPGRRRIIKVVYAMLAILLAVGLVGFGIGSDATGGISEIFGQGGGADTGFEDEIEDAEKRAEENPKDPAAQVALVNLYIQQGRQQLDVDEATQQPIVTSEAEESYNKAADSFAAYLALKPKRLDSAAALQMAGAFFLLAQGQQSLTDAVAEVENAAEAQQVAVDAEPSRGNLGNLAFYLLLAGQFDRADAVIAQAVAKGSKESEFAQARQQGEALQKQLKQEQKQGAAAEGENPLGGAGGALGGDTGALGTP
jgi:hypothetical protein